MSFEFDGPPLNQKWAGRARDRMRKGVDSAYGQTHQDGPEKTLGMMRRALCRWGANDPMPAIDFIAARTASGESKKSPEYLDVRTGLIVGAYIGTRLPRFCLTLQTSHTGYRSEVHDRLHSLGLIAADDPASVADIFKANLAQPTTRSVLAMLHENQTAYPANRPSSDIDGARRTRYMGALGYTASIGFEYVLARAMRFQNIEKCGNIQDREDIQLDLSMLTSMDEQEATEEFYRQARHQT